MIDFSNLRKINLSDKDVIERLNSLLPNQSCERSFVNLFVWADIYNTKILKLTENSAVIFSEANNIMFFPFGEELEPYAIFEIATCFKKQMGLNKIFIYDVPEYYVKKYTLQLEKYFKVGEHTDEFDYIYSIEKLLNFSGKKLRKKKNLVSQFETLYPDFYCEKISEKNKEKAFCFVEKINTIKEKSILFNGLYREDDALKKAFLNFEDLGLEGILLYSQLSEIVGCAIFSKLNCNTWNIHFEKSNSAIKGAPQKLVFCEALALKNFGAEFMNREQDLDLENLRKAKESLDPIYMFRRHYLVSE